MSAQQAGTPAKFHDFAQVRLPEGSGSRFRNQIMGAENHRIEPVKEHLEKTQEPKGHTLRLENDDVTSRPKLNKEQPEDGKGWGRGGLKLLRKKTPRPGRAIMPNLQKQTGIRYGPLVGAKVGCGPSGALQVVARE